MLLSPTMAQKGGEGGWWRATGEQNEASSHSFWLCCVFLLFDADFESQAEEEDLTTARRIPPENHQTLCRYCHENLLGSLLLSCFIVASLLTV